MSLDPAPDPPPVIWLDQGSQPALCGQCGAILPDSGVACPRCEVKIVGAMEAAPSVLPRTFDIGPLMVMIGAMAVCLAAMRIHIVLGLLLTAPSCLAFLRTFGGIARRKSVGCPLDYKEQLALLSESFAVALLLLFYGGVVFVMAIVVLGPALGYLTGPLGLVVAGLISSVLAGLVVRFASREFWPIRHRGFGRSARPAPPAEPMKVADSHARGGAADLPPQIDPK
jgi:hypothetical protein